MVLTPPTSSPQALLDAMIRTTFVDERLTPDN
jgi:hypothetical protein